MALTDHEKQILARLRKVSGQLNGIARMVEERRYCIDILTQLASATAALHAIEDRVMRRHLETCVAEALRTGDPDEQRKKLDEIMEILTTFRHA